MVKLVSTSFDGSDSIGQKPNVDINYIISN
jgi:hypothetical protein